MRVPYLNINPSMAIPMAKAKNVRLIKDRTKVKMPILSILKLNTKKDNIMLMKSIMHAFTIPENAWAKIYSLTIRGAINILLKFLAQIFQRLPTATEYSTIQIICHNNIPKSTFCPMILRLLPPRYRDKKPKTTIFANGKKKMSIITSTE